MFTLLRKIRSSLIESGSTKKYLFYAIGEILLVMIGILLAMQVNNWNNQRLERIQKQAYLVSLKKDSKVDLDGLYQLMKRAENYVSKFDSLSLQLSEKLTKEKLDLIGIQRQTYFLKDDTYREIIANGHLKLLPDSVKSILLDLNSLFKLTNKIDSESARQLNTQHLKMADYYELKRLNRTSEYKVTIGENTDPLEAILVYRNYINVCYDWMKTQLYFYGLLRKKHQELLISIENEDIL